MWRRVCGVIFLWMFCAACLMVCWICVSWMWYRFRSPFGVGVSLVAGKSHWWVSFFAFCGFSFGGRKVPLYLFFWSCLWSVLVCLICFWSCFLIVFGSGMVLVFVLCVMWSVLVLRLMLCSRRFVISESRSPQPYVSWAMSLCGGCSVFRSVVVSCCVSVVGSSVVVGYFILSVCFCLRMCFCM